MGLTNGFHRALNRPLLKTWTDKSICRHPDFCLDDSSLQFFFVQQQAVLHNMEMVSLNEALQANSIVNIMVTKQLSAPHLCDQSVCSVAMCPQWLLLCYQVTRRRLARHGCKNGLSLFFKPCWQCKTAYVHVSHLSTCVKQNKRVDCKMHHRELKIIHEGICFIDQVF